MTTKNPNVMLGRIRSSVVALSRCSPAVLPPVVHDLIYAVKELDDHLSWGGPPPEDWRGDAFRAVPTPAHEADPVEMIIRRM